MVLRSIVSINESYIKGTSKGEVVIFAIFCFASIKRIISIQTKIESRKVHVSTRSLKHLYDKRTAEEFDFITEHLRFIVTRPDRLYRNKSGKRGFFCLVKEIRNDFYLCSLEKVDVGFEVVTCFRTDEAYLKNCELLWKWKGGDLHRNAFDIPQGGPNNIPQ